MSIDWDKALYDPLFGIFGVSASLNIGGAPISVMVIDKTAGVEVGMSEVELPVIAPVAMIRASEMASNDLTEDALLEATITIRGKAWTIKNVAARPGPDGKSSGEFMLILLNGDL